MKMKNYTFILLLAIPFIGTSQSFSGEITYKSATSMDIKMDSTRVTPEQQKMIKERMSKAMQKEYTLSFNKTESLFKEVEQLDEGNARMAGMVTMLTGTGGLVYKNIKTKQLLDQTEFFGKQFLIQDTLESFNWKLGKKTKQIGSYTCYEATASRQIINRVMKSSEDGGSTLDTTIIQITAWYTPQIPLSNGPDIYWGLPGLILEVNTDKTVILCTKVALSKEEIEIKPPKNGDKVTRDEYTTIIEKKMKEMEEMYGGKGRGRGGHPRMQIQMSR